MFSITELLNNIICKWYFMLPFWKMTIFDRKRHRDVTKEIHLEIQWTLVTLNIKKGIIDQWNSRLRPTTHRKTVE